MQVAVGIGGDGLVVLREGEDYLGLGAGAEAFTLPALLCLQVYPFDVVLLEHGVLGGADVHVNLVLVDADYGDVLFLGGIGGVGHELGHFFAAAGGDLAAVLDEADDVAAMLADEEFGGCMFCRVAHGVHSFVVELEGKGGRGFCQVFYDIYVKGCWAGPRSRLGVVCGCMELIEDFVIYVSDFVGFVICFG